MLEILACRGPHKWMPASLTEGPKQNQAPHFKKTERILQNDPDTLSEMFSVGFVEADLEINRVELGTVTGC